MRMTYLLGCVAVLAVACPAVAQASGEQANAAGHAELLETIRSLQAQLAEQQRRLEQLEARQSPPPEDADRQALRQVVQQLQAEARSGSDFRVYWREGLRLDSYDENFRLRIGGRLQMDWWWAGGSITEQIPTKDGVRIRRLRTQFSGEIYKDFWYCLSIELAGSGVTFAEANVAMRNIPVIGTLTVGRFTLPASLEEFSSNNFTTFMERGMLNSLVPGTGTGVTANDTLFDERMTWAVSFFRRSDGQGTGISDGGYGLVYRVTGLPYYQDGGRRLVHLGFSHTLLRPRPESGSGPALRYRSRPEVRIDPFFLDTGGFDADWLNILAGEVAAVLGPLSLQGEVVASLHDADAVGDPSFCGFYAQASYFLTGENRSYQTASGTFGRIRPKKNFAPGGGWGAWELAARYSYLSLSDAAIAGGRMQAATVGLNWYLNPNMRVMANYVRTCVDRDFSAGSNIFGMRFQVDF